VSDAPVEVAAAAQSADASAEPGAGRRLKRFFLLLLFYIAVGPPVGSMVFMTCSAVIQVKSVNDLQYIPLAPLVGLALAPFSYLLGALPAAFGGLFVAGWQAFLGRVSLAGILALGTALAAVFVYATEGATLPRRPVIDWGLIASMFLTALLPTVICWYPMRKRYYPATGSSASAAKVTET
jgi:hypothetical protein